MPSWYLYVVFPALVFSEFWRELNVGFSELVSCSVHLEATDSRGRVRAAVPSCRLDRGVGHATKPVLTFNADGVV